MEQTEVVLWPEGERRDIFLEAALGMATWSLFAWILVDGWQVTVAVVVAGLGFAAWAFLAVPRILRLTEVAVIEQRRGRTRSVPLASVHRIRSEWIPYRSPEITIETRTGECVSFALSDSAKPFVLALGAQLIDRRKAIHVKPSVVKALGWPETSWQMD